jgi:hypothetical protein
LSTLFYWKIAPPLTRKVLAICAEREWVWELFFCGNGAGFVEMRTKCALRLGCKVSE